MIFFNVIVFALGSRKIMQELPLWVKKLQYINLNQNQWYKKNCGNFLANKLFIYDNRIYLCLRYLIFFTKKSIY